MDHNQWLSNEKDISVSQRSSIGFNVNCNDAKIRNNRALRFLHLGIVSGGGTLIIGNHFFQDDSTGGNIRSLSLLQKTARN